MMKTRSIGPPPIDLVRDVDVAAARVVRLGYRSAPTVRWRHHRRRRCAVRVRLERDRRDEAIAAPVRGLDERRRPRIVVERAADLADAHLERAVADVHVSPRELEQLVLRDELPGPRGSRCSRTANAFGARGTTSSPRRSCPAEASSRNGPNA